MRTSPITPEEQRRILDRYKNDPVIKKWVDMMAHVAAIAPMQYVITIDGEGYHITGTILDEITQKQLTLAEEALRAYCKSNYPELYETNV